MLWRGMVLPSSCVSRRLALVMMLALLLLGSAGASRKDKTRTPAVRWNEDHPGCTFSRDEDGKFRYGLWSGDVGITVAVDSQELEKVHRRHEPFFSAFVDVRYRGDAPVDLATDTISLQFVRHFQVVHTALDPDAFADKVQADADEVDHQAAREVQKHPEKKSEKEALVRAFQKDAAELLEFVGKNSLRPMRLDASNSETSGWVLFSTDSKWISGWKKQEEFVLRIPFEGKIFEFPFTLPPKPGEIMLRKRE
jgi:hypothetical protein